eukprot:CAMPEP_0196572564 /NCGR_PEP_ID=MMETSP1081-20130531/2596_1 /TAXON_ID=36882 /ORGANISM="Pyramimonas amylifera, Strain CCMP720" /LENGTH=114 /DNA_ID=CAMNT_0041889923 /DNA_START=533 /DNA_END=877 /DNA_ORIENTATION=+
MCTKPCFGGMVVVTPCPNDSCGYLLCTRCQAFQIFNSPLLLCIEDSESAKRGLNDAIDKFTQKGGRIQVSQPRPQRMNDQAGQQGPQRVYQQPMQTQQVTITMQQQQQVPGGYR